MRQSARPPSSGCGRLRQTSHAHARASLFLKPPEPALGPVGEAANSAPGGSCRPPRRSSTSQAAVYGSLEMPCADRGSRRTENRASTPPDRCPRQRRPHASWKARWRNRSLGATPHNTTASSRTGRAPAAAAGAWRPTRRRRTCRAAGLAHRCRAAHTGAPEFRCRCWFQIGAPEKAAPCAAPDNCRSLH